VPRATHTPQKFGICPSFRVVFSRPAPNLNSPIRNFYIAVCPRSGTSSWGVCTPAQGCMLKLSLYYVHCALPPTSQ
jgi:hypothetical protein